MLHQTMHGGTCAADNVAISHRKSGAIDTAAGLSASYGTLAVVAAAAPLLARSPADRGRGVTIGLIEPAIHASLPDLAGAAVSMRHVAGVHASAEALCDHGSFSATLLVGQGDRVVRGLVPAAGLLVALVAGADGIGRPEAVAAALDWLSDSAVDVIAIPMASDADHPAIAAALDRAASRRVTVFAAAGNTHPAPLAFPARHPGVIAVGAVGPGGRLRRECCRGRALSMRMPGTAIAGTADGLTPVRRSGSSIACVVAAGLAALSRSAQRHGSTPPARRSPPRHDRAMAPPKPGHTPREQEGNGPCQTSP